MSASEPSARTRPAALGPDWLIYRGTGQPNHEIQLDGMLPPPPPWRVFDGGPLPSNDVPPAEDAESMRRLGSAFHLTDDDVNPHEVDMVNAALYLRRPLLVTGPPGTGKSSLAFRIARELRLGRVLRWPITSLTTLKSGLYLFDAIGRVQAAGTLQASVRLGIPDQPGSERSIAEPPIGDFVKLGPLGTAFLPRRLPRVLLIDELDKSEADLPNDLLSIFEDGEFTIPELERVRNREPQVQVFTNDTPDTAAVADGVVRCNAFPVIVITSNGEREFPPAFLRRCLRLETQSPDADLLAKIVANHLVDADGKLRQKLIVEFVEQSRSRGLPIDKLLEAVYLATSGAYRDNDERWTHLRDTLWRQLTSMVP